MTDQTKMFGREGVGEVRDEKQRHFTPAPLAYLIIERLAARLGWVPEVLVEPSCGAGAFFPAAKEVWPDVYTIGVDIDKKAEGLEMCDEGHNGDWIKVAEGLAPRSDLGCSKVLVVGNPPFSATTKAQYNEVIAHVQAARNLGDAACLILPWSMLGAPRWSPIMWRENTPNEAWPLHPRPWPKHLREAAAYLWRRVRTRVDPLQPWRRS